PHPGMGYGMYGPHAGMHHPRMGYHSHPHKGKGAIYGQPYGKPGYESKAADDQGYEESSTPAAARQDIVSIASGSADFETLVTAVKAAGLADTLTREGPFTVFAPTDEAFAKLPVEQLAALLADKEALTEVLKYHVVPGTVSSSAVAKLGSARTVQGGSLIIDTSDGVRINGANVVKADIEASNGVIHVIDTVILPNQE
ncbi:MAG: fasciclin domain-containing protein, partial [Thiohalobacterales bacterium]|nr:fasciclin domain-containing protein [Thiohalobacterales bacterium]